MFDVLRIVAVCKFADCELGLLFNCVTRHVRSQHVKHTSDRLDKRQTFVGYTLESYNKKIFFLFKFKIFSSQK